MARVNALLSDVNTKSDPIPPDAYRLKIMEIKEKTEGGRQNFNLKLAINDGGEYQGRVVYHNIAMHEKNGDPNRVGKQDIKRFFEAVLGIDPDDVSYDWDSVDTDMLLNQEVQADVYIDAWEKRDPNDPTRVLDKGQNNKIKAQTVQAVN
jgi:hypothetical protein